MSSPSASLEDSQTLGRMEAERFDDSLRDLERREREDRLARLALGVDEGPAGVTGGGESAVVRRLLQDVERLAGFHHAVMRSRPWRLIQGMRRLVGRAW